MSVPGSSPSSRGQGGSSGWTAFDLKQRQKQGLIPQSQAQAQDDPFPPMPNAVPALPLCTNLSTSNDLSARSFSSVLNPSGKFPTLKQSNDSIKPINMGKHFEEDESVGVEKNNNDFAIKKLKELHSWADDSLIEDVLLASSKNIREASALLKAMVSSSVSHSQDIKETRNNTMSSTISDFPSNANCEMSFTSGKDAEVGQSSKVDERNDNLNKFPDVHGNKLDGDTTNLKLILGQLTSIPFEPEWEEDDVYLSHRKDAIRMIRSASQHSRAATNAFLRGDHFAAQQHSQSAQEEWLAAQRLNAEAAREILSIRNSGNDLWKLDLHGLHAAEAVEALRERLRQLETQVTAARSVSPNRPKENNGILCSSSVETFSSMDKMDKRQTASSKRPTSTSLQVITGIGNHSRGQAALPAAVRSFLLENGYRFDEARPGLITVRPKFRRR